MLGYHQLVYRYSVNIFFNFNDTGIGHSLLYMPIHLRWLISLISHLWSGKVKQPPQNASVINVGDLQAFLTGWSSSSLQVIMTMNTSTSPHLSVSFQEICIAFPTDILGLDDIQELCNCLWSRLLALWVMECDVHPAMQWAPEPHQDPNYLLL